MFLPYGNLLYDTVNPDMPDPENPDTVWVRALFLAPIGKPITYTEYGEPIYHLNGEFEFKVYDGSEPISIRDSDSYFPNGIDINVYDSLQSGEARAAIHLQSGVFANLSEDRQNNLDIVVLKDGEQVGTRKLNYHETADVKIDDVKVSGKNVQVILSSTNKNYLLKDAVFLEIHNSNGDIIKESHFIQPRFDKNGKYNCPVLKLDCNTNGKLTVNLFEQFMGWQPYDVLSWRIDQRTITVK